MAVENVVWPRYIDASVSRGDGRRVPRSEAVEEPTAEFEPVEEGTTAESDATPTDTEQAGESSPTEAVTSDGVPVATDDAATEIGRASCRERV